MQQTCATCGDPRRGISSAVGVCVECLRNDGERAVAVALSRHSEVRSRFGLPGSPPKDAGGVSCSLCSAECLMGEGSVAYCGLRGKRSGRFFTLSSVDHALLHYYLDPHVTNCCSAWFCPAGTGHGYPKYAAVNGPEFGHYNLALFFYGCCFNCLYCQNWTHKLLNEAKHVSADALVNLTMTNSKITCWCWFGGSPEPQLPFAVNASRKALEAKPPARVLRICYEWNGDGNPTLVRRAAEAVFDSGGNIKFDLKAYNSAVHRALTGRDNARTLSNFELVYNNFYEKRRDVPILTATTLLVPHYVDEVEVADIAQFIANLDDEIPYSLLIFHPDFQMHDLPVTPREQVFKCYRAAKRFLKNVNIGNIHLLGISGSRLAWKLHDLRTLTQHLTGFS